MKLTYDPRRNIGYLRFNEKTAEVETIQVSDSLTADIVPDGTIYGIELLNADQQLRGDNGGHFVIVNEAAGKTEDIEWRLRLESRHRTRDRRRQSPHL